MLRALLKRLLSFVILVAVVGGAGIGFLMARTADPRASEGWERLADLPDARGEVASAVGTPSRSGVGDSGSTWFVIGGIGGLGQTKRTVSTYDPAADGWSKGPDLPEGRHHAAAAAPFLDLYVSGGAKKSTNWTPERQLWLLKNGGSAWMTLAPMPEGRMGHQLVRVVTKLYVIGGRGDTSNALIYDVATNTWSTGAEMPKKRDHLAAVAVGTRIYAIGGRDDSLLRRVDVYDTARDSWSTGPDLPVPMSAMAAGVLSDGIHVVGGEDPNTFTGGVIDRHFVLPEGDNEWREAPVPIVGTHGSAAGVLGDRLVIAGGARRQGSLSPLGWTGITQAYSPGR